MKILVLGVSGMIGSSIYREIVKKNDHQVWGTSRSKDKLFCLSEKFSSNLIYGFDVLNTNDLFRIIGEVKPNIVINCVGITKHLHDSINPLVTIPLNSIFPHKLEQLCKIINARMIHISTDCVFSGARGNYTENDIADATDLYGRSKALGEIISTNSVTLRTSTIGHEYKNKFGLLEWFLSQRNQCDGYKKAFFSGLTSDELARVVCEYVIPNYHLKGIYHVGGRKIDKFSLLKIIAKEYNHPINIIPDEIFEIDRSINSDKFRIETGYLPLNWEELIQKMYENYVRGNMNVQR